MAQPFATADACYCSVAELHYSLMSYVSSGQRSA